MSSVRRRISRCACAFAAITPAALPAQTIVSGFVRDSLSGLPLAGATIQLVPSATPWAAGRTARSDSIGRFRIDSVPGGSYIFGFQHPRLDTLGLDAVTRQLDIPPALRVIRADLAIPSGRTFVASLCGAQSDSSGAVIGRVFNADDSAPIGSGSVLVRWAEMRAGVGGVRRVPVQKVAKFGTDGRYVACGVPTDAPVLLLATAAAADSSARTGTSGEVELTFAEGNPLLHRNLLIALPEPTVAASATTPVTAAATPQGVPPSAAAPTPRRARTGTARLVGRVLSATGTPVNGARVSIIDTDVIVGTDSTGTFRANGLPTGTRGIEVIAIGHAPLRSAVDLRPNRESAITLTVKATVTTLGAVNVTGVKPDRAGFSTRRTKGLGFFLDGDAVVQRGAQSISQALIGAPSLHGNGYDRDNPTRPLVSGRGNCTPTAYVDGQRMNDGLAGVDNLLTVRRVGGIEVYANPNEAPPQFHGTDGSCAVIVVWTKAYVP